MDEAGTDLDKIIKININNNININDQNFIHYYKILLKF